MARNVSDKFDRILDMIRNNENKSKILDAIVDEYAQGDDWWELESLIKRYASIYARELFDKEIEHLKHLRDVWV